MSADVDQALVEACVGSDHEGRSAADLARAMGRTDLVDLFI
jgi:hypothetical protein